MHAQILRKIQPAEKNPLEWSVVPDPQPGPGQICLRISACGVCHTDLHIVEGDLPLPRLPVIPGHQVVGRVVSVGPDVTQWSAGQRAGVPWLYRTCGRCEFCKRGEENLCPNAEFTGLHHDGGYAEYMLADADFALPIPDIFDDEHAAPLLCAGIIGYRSLHKADLQPGDTLGLFGFGASANIAVQIARFRGCRVFVFTRSASHRRHALDLGAEWAGAAEDAAPAPIDRGVIFAPSGAILPLALRHIRPGGTLAVNAVSMSNIPEFPYSLLYGERTIRSVANATRRDAAEFLRLAVEIPIQVATRIFGMKEANTVLALLKTSQLDGAAVLIPE
jgi:propanol-preferring alcohol dehydrogenase